MRRRTEQQRGQGEATGTEENEKGASHLVLRRLDDPDGALRAGMRPEYAKPINSLSDQEA